MTALKNLPAESMATRNGRGLQSPVTTRTGCRPFHTPARRCHCDRALFFLLLILALALPARGSYILFAFTNSLNQPDTNWFRVIPVSGPVANADGSFTTIGVPIRVQPGPDGRATNQLAQNNYYVTNAYLGQGYYFRAPADSGATVYPSGGAGQLISGGNVFVTLSQSASTVTNITLNTLTNSLSFLPLTPAQTTNAAQAVTNGYPWTVLFDLTGAATNQGAANTNDTIARVAVERTALNASNAVMQANLNSASNILAGLSGSGLTLSGVTNISTTAISASNAVLQAAIVATNALLLADIAATNLANLTITTNYVVAASNVVQSAVMATNTLTLAALVASNVTMQANLNAASNVIQAAISATNLANLTITTNYVVAASNVVQTALISTNTLLLADITATNLANLISTTNFAMAVSNSVQVNMLSASNVLENTTQPANLYLTNLALGGGLTNKATTAILGTVTTTNLNNQAVFQSDYVGSVPKVTTDGGGNVIALSFTAGANSSVTAAGIAASAFTGAGAVALTNGLATQAGVLSSNLALGLALTNNGTTLSNNLVGIIQATNTLNLVTDTNYAMAISNVVTLANIASNATVAANIVITSNGLLTVLNASNVVVAANMLAASNVVQSAIIATNTLLLADIAATNLANLTITTNYVVAASNVLQTQILNVSNLTAGVSNNVIVTSNAEVNLNNLMLSGVTPFSAISFTNYPYETNSMTVLGVENSGFGADGTYVSVAANVWTNISTPFAITTNGISANLLSNGVAWETATPGPVAASWGQTGPGPISATMYSHMGVITDANGNFVKGTPLNTNLTARLLALGALLTNYVQTVPNGVALNASFATNAATATNAQNILNQLTYLSGQFPHVDAAISNQISWLWVQAGDSIATYYGGSTAGTNSWTLSEMQNWFNFFSFGGAVGCGLGSDGNYETKSPLVASSLIYVTCTGNCYLTNDNNVWFPTSVHAFGSPFTATFSVWSSGSGNEIYANLLKVYYIATNNAGSFSVYTNAAGTYNQILDGALSSVSVNNGAGSVGTVLPVFSGPAGWRTLMISNSASLGVGNGIDFIGACLRNTGSNGVATMQMALGGLNLTNITLVPTNITGPIFADINKDGPVLMTVAFLDDSNSWAIGLPQLTSFISNWCTNTDVAIITPQMQIGDTTTGEFGQVQLSFQYAKQNSWPLFNAYGLFGSTNTLYGNGFVTASSAPHLVDTGASFLASALTPFFGFEQLSTWKRANSPEAPLLAGNIPTNTAIMNPTTNSYVMTTKYVGPAQRFQIQAIVSATYTASANTNILLYYSNAVSGLVAPVAVAQFTATGSNYLCSPILNPSSMFWFTNGISTSGSSGDAVMSSSMTPL